MMKNTLAAVVTALVISAPLSTSAATLTNWGTQASVLTVDCGAACSFGTVLGGLLLGASEYATDGAANQLSAESMISNAQGSAEAHADVMGGALSAPHLQVAASSNANGFAGAVASAIQGYDYTGSGETITVNINVTGSVCNGDLLLCNSPVAGADTELGAYAYLFTSTQLFEFLSTPASGTDVFFSNLALSDLENVAELPDNPDPDQRNPFSVFVTDPAVDLNGSLSIEVGDGTVTPQQFYLATFLYGFADGDGDAVQSLNSLNVEIDPLLEMGTLSAAGVAIPLPAAVWLLLPALLGTLARKRHPA